MEGPKIIPFVTIPLQLECVKTQNSIEH